LWNAYVKDGGDPTFKSSADLTEVQDDTELGGRAADGGDADMVALVDQTPSNMLGDPTYQDPVYLATLAMIAKAKTTIDISNAYYIATPPIQEALKAAMLPPRSVRVRIHTNGEASVDDPSLLRPIRRGFAPLMDQATAVGKPDLAQIFERNGSTLHSKYMVVDGTFGWVGSYNLHPRSYRYENEMVLAFNGKRIGQQVQAAFDDDVAVVGKNGTPPQSTKVNVESVRLKKDAATDFIEFLFFDLL
jgi:phosphatidylserine/phosphatidylglycerophosphate/cardiolipin synthase-like enzyme